MGEVKHSPGFIASRLRGMASDPRNVGDMRLLVQAANAVEEHAEMLALLRQAFDVPPDIFGPNYDDRCLVSRGSPLHLRVLALLARIDG